MLDTDDLILFYFRLLAIVPCSRYIFASSYNKDVGFLLTLVYCLNMSLHIYFYQMKSINEIHR